MTYRDHLPGRLRPVRHGRTVVAVATCGALLGLAGCGSSGGSSSSGGPTGSAKHPITITFANWADAEPTTEPGIKAAIAQFEKLHPNIKVKEVPISFTDIGHQLVLQVKSGNTPDIAELSGNDTYSVDEAGGLEPLSSYANSSFKSSIIPSELKAGEIDGKLVAVPWADAPPALWYNKTLMAKAGLNPKEPPTTITQLVSDLKAVKSKLSSKVVPLGIDTSNRDFSLSSNWPWMQTFGVKPYSGSKGTADTSAMKSYLSFIREIKGDIQPLQKIGTERPLAADNELVFTWDQALLQGVIQSDNHMSDADFYKTWGVASLPKGPAGTSNSIELGHQLVMFKNSKYKTADWQFIDWLATSPWAVENYTIKYESSLPPLAHPNAAISKLLNTPVSKAFSNEIATHLTPVAYGPYFEEAYPPIMSGIQSALTSNASISSIAAKMQSGLEDAFK